MEKYSKLIFDFARPIILDTDKEETVQYKMKTAQIFWNYPIARKFHMPAFEKLEQEVNTAFEKDEEFKTIGELLIDRKNNEFGDHNHFIRNLLVNTSPEGDIETMVSTFSPAKFIGLGTIKKPAVVNVQTEDEAFQILEAAKLNAWNVLAEVREDLPRETMEWEILNHGLVPGPDFKLNPSRNEPCICGSGKLFKRCCGK